MTSALAAHTTNRHHLSFYVVLLQLLPALPLFPGLITTSHPTRYRFIDVLTHSQIRASNPVRSRTSSPVLPKFGSSLPPSRRGSQDHFKQAQFHSVPQSMAGNRENTDHLAAPSPPLSIRGSRSGTSPSSRPPKLNALSPLQAFSPLQSMKTPMHVSDTAGTGSLTRSRSSSSVTRSLSRRESMVENAQRWRSGLDADDDGKGLFSRLTLVKAPRKKDDVRR